jgi:hypothetical protein
MKKKHLFIIIGQSIAILLLVVYAFVQQTIAKESQRAAEASQVEALKQQDAAEAARKEAEVQRLAAEQQRMLADAARVECQKKSK